MIGVLCIHGFTGSPKEIEPLVQYIKMNTNWTVKAPTLPGHGHSLRLKGVAYEHWIRCAEEELLKLMDRCEKIYVCGYSMGGLIGSLLSVRYPVDRLVLLSASAFYLNPKLLYREMIQMAVNGWKQSFKGNETFMRYKRKLVSTPVSAYMQFRKLVKHVRPIVKEVQVPTFIIQGKRDPIVPERSARYFYENICSAKKRLLFIEEANHLICYGEYGDRLFREIVYFLEGGSSGEKIAIDHN